MSDDVELTEQEQEQKRRKKAFGRIYRRSIRFAGDKEHLRMPFPGALYCPRNVLVDALAAVFGEEGASAVVEALDAYLDEDPASREPALQWRIPSYEKSDLAEARRQRDEAVARAQKAEQTLKASRRTKPPKGKRAQYKRAS